MRFVAKRVLVVWRVMLSVDFVHQASFIRNKVIIVTDVAYAQKVLI